MKKKSYIEEIGEKFMKDFIKAGAYPPKPLKPLKTCVCCGQPIVVSSKLKEEGNFDRDYYYHLCDKCYRRNVRRYAYAELMPPEFVKEWVKKEAEEVAELTRKGFNLPQHEWVELNKKNGDRIGGGSTTGLKTEWEEYEQRCRDRKYQQMIDAEAIVPQKLLNLNQNQKAIECLKEVKEDISKGLEYDYDVQVWFEEYIDNKIKELEEENERN